MEYNKENPNKIQKIMEHYLIKQQHRIYYYTWEMEKDNLDMGDLAIIFGCSVDKLYRIIRQERIKEYEKKKGRKNIIAKQ